MPARRLLTPVALLLVLTITPGAAADSADWPEHRRIYLGATDTNATYWTVDPHDPELSRSRLVQRCGFLELWRLTDPQKPCFSGGVGDGRFYTTYFMPGSLLEGAPSWNRDNPLRFHLELGIEALDDYTVKLLLQQDTSLWESPPATEVSPGIFEGEMTATPLPLDGAVNFFGFTVETPSERLVTDLRLRGASWIELPEPFGAKAVPDLISEDVYEPQHTTFETATRGFTFNDVNWESWSFEGELGDATSFDVEIDRRAEAVVAWIELFDKGLIHGLTEDGTADARTVTDGGAVRLLRAGEEIAHSAGPYLGQGTAALSALGVAPGPVTLEASHLDLTGEPIEFEAHVVAVYGERTLESMRWRQLGDWMFRLPVVATCPSPSEPVPVTDQVLTWKVDMDVQTTAPGFPAWAVGYEIPDVGAFPCGEDTGSDWIRFTIPGTDVWHVGPTPAKHGQYVSVYDTLFDWEVRYTYTAPPVA